MNTSNDIPDKSKKNKVNNDRRAINLQYIVKTRTKNKNKNKQNTFMNHNK